MGGGVKGDLMEGATATEDGTAGLVPPPPKGTIKRYLRADGIWCPPDGGNADTIDGFHASETRNAADTCVVRDASGYVQLGYINSDTPDNEDPAISQVVVTNGSDDYYRKASLAQLKDYLRIKRILGNTLFLNLNPNLSGTKQYICFLSVYTYAWAPAPSMFWVSTRKTGHVRFRVSFNDSGSSDCGIRSFECVRYGDIGNIFAVKSGSRVWDFYISTSDSTDWAHVFGFSLGYQDFSYKYMAITSLPTGAIQATEVTSMP